MRFLLLLFLFSSLASRALASETATISQGHWRAEYSPTRGVMLWYAGVQITRQSTLYLVKPGWTEVLYNPRDVSPTVAVTEENGSKIITAQDQNADVSVSQRIILGADDTATLDLTYALRRDIPAQIEYAAGYVNAALFAGMPFSAQTAQGRRSGTIPYSTPSTDQVKNMFVPSFQALTVDTHLGAMTVATSGDWPDYVCFDARRDPQDWAQDSPIFWLGVGVAPHPVAYDHGKTYRTTVRLSFAPLSSNPTVTPTDQGSSLSAFTHTGQSTSLTLVPNARVPLSTQPLVIPTPKSIRFSGSSFYLNTQTRIVIADHATSADRLSAQSLADELKTRFGLRLSIVNAHDVIVPKNIIVLGQPAHLPLASRLLKMAGAAPSAHAEGYLLRVGQGWAVVAGHDPAGTFYGTQTLCQLLNADPQGTYLWNAQVDDYPSLPWRGAHLFVGDHALPFHKQLIARVFARLKMNNLVLQCEQAKWDTLGKSAPAWGISKSDLRDEIAFAHAHLMTVTPLINSAGHMDWLLSDPHRRDLAEDPQTPYAANVTNPATYQFLFRLYDEVLETFHSRFLHIGGDEVTLRGRFPDRSKGKYPTVADAFLAHINKVYQHLKSKGVGTMIWGDMLLASGEAPDATNAVNLRQAQKIRKGLPKDIVITDWHYASAGNFISPQVLQRAGFSKIIGATWYPPANIAAFSRALAAQKQHGLLQTTWVGYNSSAQNFKSDPKQFAAFVLAADNAWNGGHTPAGTRSYNPVTVFESLYESKPVDGRRHAGFLVNLATLGNRSLTDTSQNSGWLGLGPEHDLHTVPTGQVRLGEMLYQIAPSALMLAGALTPSVQPSGPDVTIPIGQTASRLSLLLTTGYVGTPKTSIGSLLITYETGTQVHVPLVYGQNIASWDDMQDAPDAPIVWQGQTTAGDRIALRALTWTNPNPAQPIQSITLTETDPGVSPALLALTGIDAP